MQKITPFLWFDNNAEEAVNFYLSVFKDARIHNIATYPEGTSSQPGSVMVIDFELMGQQFSALNGGPVFHFTEAVSFVIHCKTQEELDEYWNKLSDGGEIQMCGWLKDKYGLSWQVVPQVLLEMILDENKERKQAVMDVMMKMQKIDIAPLKAAYEQNS